MLSISPTDLIFAIINFVILVAVLGKFLYKPILRTMDERKQGIEDALNAAAEARKEVAATQETLTAEIARAHSEGEAIIAKAMVRGEEAKNQIIEEARSEAAKISAEARQQITEEKDRAIRELKSEIADLALLATERLLTAEITADQQHLLMDKYIKEVGQIQ